MERFEMDKLDQQFEYWRTRVPLGVYRASMWRALELLRRDTPRGMPRDVHVPGLLERYLGMVLRQLAQWERVQLRRLFDQCQPHLMGHVVAISTQRLLDIQSRHPRYRRPEPAGFEMDRWYGWRRFRETKTALKIPG
jgi:hypothetical protein